MNNFKLLFTKRAQKQARLSKSLCQAKQNNINRVLRDLESDPTVEHIGSKPINRMRKGCFSKEISRGDRIVYAVDRVAKVVIIMNIIGHYCDNGGKLF